MKKPAFSEQRMLHSLQDASLAITPPHSRKILWACLVCIASFLAWAAWAEIDEVTRGDGRVVPHSRVQKIQSLEGGILKQLHVAEGQEVEAGQLLAEIDNTRFRTAFLESKAHIEALSVAVARLEAEALNKERIEFPASVTPDSSVVATELALFQAKRAKHQAAKAALYKELQLTRQQLAVVTPLAQSRSVSEMEVLRLSREAASLQGRIAEIDNDYFQQAHNELSSKKAELLALEQAVPQKEDQLKRTQVISPVKGQVNAIFITTRGGVIQPGEAMMEITPIEDQLLVEAKIKPKDVAFLVPGMQARVKITAYDYSIFGDLSGQLEQISPDTIEEETPRGKEAFYKILVRTDRSYLEKGDYKLPIKPGMIAEIDVINGRRSILNYLLRPLLKARLA